jgi:hypothetical protein
MRKVANDPERRGKLSEGKRGPKNPNWKGGPSARKKPPSQGEIYRNSKHWKHKTKEIQRRDGHQCQSCSTGKDLDTHHQYPINDWIDDGHDPRDYPDEWLSTLCKSCHKKSESQEGVFKPPISNPNTESS